MYEYSDEEFIILNIEEILKRVSQEEIFEIVFGFKPKTNIYLTSPFRSDKTAGASFNWYKGKLWFIDYADNKPHRDCINCIEDFFKLSFIDSLKYINDYFKLGLGYNSTVKAKPVLYDVSSLNKREDIKGKTKILWKPRPFNIRDKMFWFDRYGITKANLMEDNTFPLVWYQVFSTRLNRTVTVRPQDVMYAFTGFEDDSIKVYRPFYDKLRFITNTSENDIGNIQNIPSTGKQLIISKSYKDCRVLKNLNTIPVWFQNEGMIPSDKNLYNLIEGYDEVIVFFDNDRKGLEASIKVKDKINSIIPDKARIVTLNEGLPKDPADMYWKKGKECLISFLIENSIILNEQSSPTNNPSFMDSISNSPF